MEKLIKDNGSFGTSMIILTVYWRSTLWRVKAHRIHRANLGPILPFLIMCLCALFLKSLSNFNINSVWYEALFLFVLNTQVLLSVSDVCC